MMLKSVLYLLVSLFIISCSDKSAELFSLVELKPVLIKEDGAELFQYWELANQAFLWGFDLGELEHINEYRDALIERLGTKNFEKFVSAEAGQHAKPDSLSAATFGDKRNAYYVHIGQLAIVRKINFLEAQLLNYQLSRYPLISHPTEFHGFILAQDSLNLIRVYFAASDQPWPPKAGILLDAIEDEAENGWRLKYHLHNHNGDESNNYIGVMAPSLADAHYYKMLSAEFGVEKALITNGFNTVEIENREFSEFDSH